MSAKRQRAERLLKADPDLKTATVAQIVGCSKGTVVHARKALGPVAHKPRKVERCEALLREEPNLDLAVVAEAVGCSYGTAYSAATRLGVNRNRRFASVIGTHQRVHVKLQRPDPECPLCRAGKGAEAAPDPQ